MNIQSGPVRDAALTIVTPRVAGRAVFLTGNAAHSQGMADFFTWADAEVVHSLVLPPGTGQLAHRFAAVERLLADPPDSLQRELEALDAAGTGVIYAGSFTAVRTIRGRHVLGARSRSHFAAERKDVQPRFLAISSGRILLDLNSISDAEAAIAAEMSRGPVVVQGVPRDLLAMATSHTYAIPTTAAPTGISHLLTSIARDCATAVLAPMDTGTPCTFYGFITRDEVIDFGPFEALVYWDNETWRIHAPGIVRPLVLGDRIETASRSSVHTTARRLHQQTGYVGAFGTDGVVTSTRYAIHEINPRVCAGFALLDKICGQPVPLAAVDLALREWPVQAGHALSGPLDRLANTLRSMQSPSIRLWDDTLNARAEQLLVAARNTSEPTAWLRLARANLATERLVHVAELDPSGAGTCG